VLLVDSFDAHTEIISPLKIHKCPLL